MRDAQSPDPSALRMERLRTAAQEAAVQWQTLHEAPDPAHYIQRENMERALETLHRSVRAGATRLTVTGPPGFGKTLLLRLFEQSADRDLHVLYIPFASLEPIDLTRWILDRGNATASGDPEADERRLAAFWTGAAAGGRRTVLLIDEAQSLDPRSAQQLSRWVDQAEGALVVVLAGLADARSERVLGFFGAPLLRISLDAPLSRDELPGFVQRLVEDCELPAPRRERVEDLVASELWGKTEGNPRLVKGELLRVMRDPAPPSPKPTPQSPRRAPTGAPPPRATKAPLRSRPRADLERARSAVPPRPLLATRPAVRVRKPPRRPGRSAQLLRAGTLAVTGCIALAAAVGLVRTGSQQAATPAPLPIPEPVPPSIERAAPESLTAEPTPAPRAPAVPPSVVPGQGFPDTSPFAPPVGLTTLAARPRSAQISINAWPWARIAVDGVPVGETPLGALSVEAGLRHFRAELPDGRVVEREIDVEDGARIVFP